MAAFGEGHAEAVNKFHQEMIDHQEQCAAEEEFLSASIAVWREIDRRSALPDGYHGLVSQTGLRKREKAAWERYRAALDSA